MLRNIKNKPNKKEETMAKKTVQVTYWIPPELKNEIDETAKILYRTKSSIAAQALKEYINQHRAHIEMNKEIYPETL